MHRGWHHKKLFLTCSRGWQVQGLVPGLMSPLPSMIRQWFPMFPTNSMGSGCTRLFLVVPGFFSSWYCKTKLGINMPWVCMNCTVQKPGWPLHELTYLIRFPQTILWIITSALETHQLLQSSTQNKQWNNGIDDGSHQVQLSQGRLHPQFFCGFCGFCGSFSAFGICGTKRTSPGPARLDIPELNRITHHQARGLHSHGGTQKGWFIIYNLDNPIKMDDLGVPHFKKPPYCGKQWETRSNEWSGYGSLTLTSN